MPDPPLFATAVICCYISWKMLAQSTVASLRNERQNHIYATFFHLFYAFLPTYIYMLECLNPRCCIVSWTILTSIR